MTMVALEGLRPWLLQRLTAVYMAVYIFYFVIYWFFFAEINYDSWSQWLKADLNLILIGLFYISLLIHAWVGIRDVLLDYIKPFMLRLSLLFLTAGFLLGCAIWMLIILQSVTD